VPALAVSQRFPQELAETHAGLAHLRLGIPHRASKHPRDLVVLVSLYNVKNEHSLVSSRQFLDSRLKSDAVNDSI